ncbi:MAG TPA: hypothetical protein VF265_08705 [Nevskiaceae bacterium]
MDMTNTNFFENLQSCTKSFADCQQQVADIWLGGVKQANDVLVNYSRSLFDAQQASSREWFASAKSAFDKASVDGFQAVLTEPARYLPSSETLNGLLFTNAWGTFAKVRDELSKVAEDATQDCVKAVEQYATDSVKVATQSAPKAAKRAASNARKAMKVDA